MTQTVTVKELMERYKLSSRQSIYSRIKALQVLDNALDVEIKDGKVSQSGLDILDALDDHLKAGGELKSFALPVTTTVVSQEEDGALSHPIQNFVLLVQEIARALTPRKSPLDPLRELDAASLYDWLLTTQQLQEIWGVAPRGEVMERGSFVATRAGKIGRQSAWRISRKGDR